MNERERTLRAFWAPFPTTIKESDMSDTPKTPETPETNGHPVPNRLVVDQPGDGHFEYLRGAIVRAHVQLDELECRVAALEEKLGSKPRRDELAEKLLECLNRYPGLVFSPTAVWKNCGGKEKLGVGNERVADKLAQLARRGLITVTREEGRNALYAGKVQ